VSCHPHIVNYSLRDFRLKFRKFYCYRFTYGPTRFLKGPSTERVINLWHKASSSRNISVLVLRWHYKNFCRVLGACYNEFFRNWVITDELSSHRLVSCWQDSPPWSARNHPLYCSVARLPVRYLLVISGVQTSSGLDILSYLFLMDAINNQWRADVFCMWHCIIFSSDGTLLIISGVQTFLVSIFSHIYYILLMDLGPYYGGACVSVCPSSCATAETVHWTLTDQFLWNSIWKAACHRSLKQLATFKFRNVALTKS
jgi:hypothetical protein